MKPGRSYSPASSAPDTLDKIGDIVYREYKEKRYASPPPLLKRMISFGYFGRKSGKGFYDYSQNRPSRCRWCELDDR